MIVDEWASVVKIILKIMGSSQSNDSSISSQQTQQTTTNNYDHAPTPTGQEYYLIDKIVSDLPNVMDDESKKQV